VDDNDKPKSDTMGIPSTSDINTNPTTTTSTSPPNVVTD
jgi:hypothetical protein